MEKWKTIENYEGLYEISNLGRVKSLAKQRGCQKGPELIIKTSISKNGYEIAHLCKNSKFKSITVHRLVANAFIPNPEKKRTINHKNFDRKDNRVENLEWVSEKENSIWSNENNRHGQLKINNPASGEHYIQKRGVNSYRFQYNKNGKCIVRIPTKNLEEAIQQRNEWFKQHEPQIYKYLQGEAYGTNLQKSYSAKRCNVRKRRETTRIH